MTYVVREAAEDETDAILQVARAAFGSEQDDEIATLIDELLRDPTADPRLSLVAVAVDDDVIVGHVIFSRADLPQSPLAVSASILAPLAVYPDNQRRGIGGMLIVEGLKRLRSMGIDLVFVLGHPAYYQKHGFSPAGVRGYDAPYPIPPKHAEAWMVQELRAGVIGKTHGQVSCAQALDDPKYWQED